MLIGETINVAFGAIRANKMRSFLTMLGIIIGIAAVITMVALGEGAQQQVEARLATLGANVLTVRPGAQFFGGIDRGENKMTPADAQALVDAASPAIVAVSPEFQRRQQVSFGRGNGNIQIVGVWPSYFDIQNFSMDTGRMFTEGEERGRRRVAVLGLRSLERLQVADARNAVGQQIYIRGVPFEVIGVLAEKGEQGGWQNPDESIYIPAATAQFRVFGTDRIGSIYVQAVNETQMDAAIGVIDRVLRREHRLRPGQPSDFNVRNQASLLETLGETTQTFTYLLAGIALISLLVGGIGIMNIMLVSVTERTREIGVRKALGARRRDIMLQFLVEALVLCIFGGALGVLIGMGGAEVVQRAAQWQTVVAPEAVILALGFSAGVGIFFGMWPARRAARLDPITALRYE
jgi:putative ABC transport system permease protein